MTDLKNSLRPTHRQQIDKTHLSSSHICHSSTSLARVTSLHFFSLIANCGLRAKNFQDKFGVNGAKIELDSRS